MAAETRAWNGTSKAARRGKLSSLSIKKTRARNTRGLVAAPLLRAATPPARAQTDGDPFGSFQWPDLEREFLHGGKVEFDARVQVRGPAFAEDPMSRRAR